MATYKKRGGRPKTKADREAKIEEESTTAGVFKTLDEGASRTEAWIEKNKNAILGVIGAVAVGVLGFFLFQEYVQKPKEAEAMNEMFQAQHYWEEALAAPVNDSLYNLSIRCREGKYGFRHISDKYKYKNASNFTIYYPKVVY